MQYIDKYFYLFIQYNLLLNGVLTISLAAFPIPTLFTARTDTPYLVPGINPVTTKDRVVGSNVYSIVCTDNDADLETVIR